MLLESGPSQRICPNRDMFYSEFTYKTIVMGRGKKWSSEERGRVTIAWSRAAHDPVVCHNQSGDTFDEKVYSLFSRKPLKDADPGTYNDRSHPSVMTCFATTSHQM